MMKTVLSVEIFELQRYFGEMKLWKLSLQRKRTAKFENCRYFVKLSDCVLREIFLNDCGGK